MFEKGNANWSSELPSVTKKYNNTIHHSTKTKTIDASMNSTEKYEKQVYSKLQDKRKKLYPKIKIGQFVRTADNTKRSLAKATVQIGVRYYIQKQKSYTIPYLVMESTIYPRDITKIHYYLLNYLLKKIIK